MSIEVHRVEYKLWGNDISIKSADSLRGVCPIGLVYALDAFHLSKTAFTNDTINSDMSDSAVHHHTL